MHLRRLASSNLPLWAGGLETQKSQWGAVLVQRQSDGDFFLIPGRVSLFLLISLPTDEMRPTHILESNLLYSTN